MTDVVIHSKPSCTYCSRAKEILQDNGIAYTEVTYGPDDPDYAHRVDALKTATHHPTFPQVFIDNSFVGGLDALMTVLPQLVRLEFD